MSKRGKKLPPTSRRQCDARRRSIRPLATTAAVIGGAGVVLCAPGAALLVAPAAQAAPYVSAPASPPNDLCVVMTGCNNIPAGNLFGAAALSAGTTTDPFTALFDLAGAIPGVNLLIGNGADGTAAHPNGFNGGLFAGSGGDGYSSTIAGADGGHGGNAGWFWGNGGKGWRFWQP